MTMKALTYNEIKLTNDNVKQNKTNKLNFTLIFVVGKWLLERLLTLFLKRQPPEEFVVHRSKFRSITGGRQECDSSANDLSNDADGDCWK